jgi:hypothetical protein
MKSWQRLMESDALCECAVEQLGSLAVQTMAKTVTQVQLSKPPILAENSTLANHTRTSGQGSAERDNDNAPGR